jgi:sulfur carrier protein
MRAQGKVLLSGIFPFVFNVWAMKVRLNDREEDISEQISLQSFLQQHGLTDAKGIAVALNHTVVPRKDWPETSLQQNDTILIIKATQGG